MTDTALDFPAATDDAEPTSSWTFLTVHAHVLLVIARDPAIRLADIARQVGVTERTTQRAVTDLVSAGYLERAKHGRRNRYKVRADAPLRHPLWRDTEIGDLIRLLAGPEAESVSG
jgi:DNA-binding IscR family transcriptional regulator